MPFDFAAARNARPSAVPAHIAAFGSRFGPRDLFHPEPEGEAKTEVTMTRAQFVTQEKATLLDKSVEYLANKNAELQYDLNAARREKLPEGQVAVSKEDAAVLSSYRELFPTPKAAKDAQEELGSLKGRDTQRSYDDARSKALEAFKDLPDTVKSLIPTAEELLKQPGGQDRLGNLEFLSTEVEKYATAYGATKQDQTEKTEVGISPGTVTAPADKQEGVTDAVKAAQDLIAKRYAPPAKKE